MAHSVLGHEAVIAFWRLALAEASLEELGARAVETLQAHAHAAAAEFYTYDEESECFRPRNGGREIAMKAPISGDLAFSHLRGAIDERYQMGLVALVGTREKPRGIVCAFAEAHGAFSLDDEHFVEMLAGILTQTIHFRETTGKAVDVLESITDCFSAYDANLNTVYVNRRMADTYGKTPKDLIGHYVTDLLNNKEHVRFYRESMETQQEVSYETHDLESDRWYTVHIYPTRDGVTSYSRDVTERKHADLRIAQMNAELERRVAERTAQLDRVNHELEAFAYAVSHDLRAPLRAIDGFSAALEEDIGDSLDETSRGYLVRVRNAAARMATLIESMLGLAKVARQELVYEPVDLSQLAGSIAAELQAGEPERDVTFRIENDLRVSAEPALMRAILENLMGNAWKFTGKKADATISVGRVAESGEFFVRDNGAGFDEAYAKKLFGAFQRLHAQDDFEGTGIGLATVARIVHRYAGDVRAEGAVDKGATFYFTIPAKER